MELNTPSYNRITNAIQKQIEVIADILGNIIRRAHVNKYDLIIKILLNIYKFIISKSILIDKYINIYKY